MSEPVVFASDEIIVLSGLEALNQAVRLISGEHDCVVQRGPQTGMVMMTHRDSVENMPFYLGEVLVTRAEVDVDGYHGFACVLGDDPERAYCGAVIDAWLESGPGSDHPAMAILNDEMRERLARRQEMDRMIGATKVRFDVKA